MIGRFVRYLVLHGLFPALCIAGGWYAGAKNGAPAGFVSLVDGMIAKVSAIAAPLAGKAGEAGLDAAGASVAYVAGTLEGIAEKRESAETDPAPSPDSRFSSGAIALCGGMRVSNPPDANRNGVIASEDAQVTLNGASISLMPATNACFSSGYGTRGGRAHKGVDYYAKTGGDVLAAADGVIVEAVARSDYGNMIVIDHGGGVYTRYAHLASFAGDARKGTQVKAGQYLGPIGQTGQAGVAHLHFEILTGEIETRSGSFGLQPNDPFSLR